MDIGPFVEQVRGSNGLPPLPATDVQRAAGMVSVRTTTPTAVVGALSAWASAAGVDELPELCVLRPTLEDVYLRLVGAESEAARA
jgi:hypothetical protein